MEAEHKLEPIEPEDARPRAVNRPNGGEAAAAGELPETLPRLFFERTQANADRVALRRKRLGLWEELTFRDYERGVEAVSAALVDLGVRPGEPVGLVSENRVEWLMSDLGILSAGAVTCAMYTTSSAEQIGHILGHSGARVLIVENEEQLDKALVLRGERVLDWIIVIDRKGLARFSDERVLFWDELIARGEARRDEHASELRARRDAIRPDDLAILVYTSGTTGPPKGVMLSHACILWTCRTVAGIMRVTPEDEVLSFLPLCHVAERSLTVMNQVVNGSVVSFAESLDTVRENLAEVRPHVFFAVPRIWEKLYNTIELRMRDAPWTKRRAYAWAVSIGRAVNARRQRALREGRDPEESVPPRLRLAYLLADRAVFLPLRHKLGLDRARIAITAAAPISPDVIDYFQSIGVPLVEAFGQTESSAILTANLAGASPLGTVGLPVPGVELKIAEDGEILGRSPGVMLGYFKDPEATAAAIDKEGFLHTGDVGELDASGRLRITDRKKDLIITSGGKNIAPQYIESKLRTSAYIHDAVVIGERRTYVTALIVLDEDNLVEWAHAARVQFGAYAELARSPAVKKLIAAEIEAVNATLTHIEAVKKFRILEKRLDQDGGELTPTLKVRRAIVSKTYAALIEEMYRGS
jgi:long-chain acyl-CoA synthetase